LNRFLRSKSALGAFFCAYYTIKPNSGLLKTKNVEKEYTKTKWEEGSDNFPIIGQT